MQLSDFEVGKSYHLTEKDFVNPLDETQVTPGRVITRKIMTPVCAEEKPRFDDGGLATLEVIKEWQQFLRVQNPETERVHLLHPEEIAEAVILS